MGILGQALAWTAPQASLAGDLLRRALGTGGIRSTAGVRISDEVAMAFGAVYACVRAVGEDVAKLPLHLLQRTPQGKERATDHPYYWLFSDDGPNAWQTSYEFREQMQIHQELRGNGYAYINRVRGEVRELIPYDHPDTVTPKRLPNWTVEYHVSGDRVRQAGEILHLRGISINGLTGLSTIRAAREAIGIGIAAERHGARVFANGARPGLVVEHPREFSEPAIANLRQSLIENSTGENAFGIVTLEDGVKLHPGSALAMSNEDAQFLGQRRFQVSEIARFWRMPPHKIADLEHAHYNNIEHQAIEYVIDSLFPRLRRTEQRLNKALLNDRERREFFFEFNIDALLRGDLLTRMRAHQIAFLNGFLNRNEIRSMENRNAVEGGDQFRVPANTVAADGDDDLAAEIAREEAERQQQRNKPAEASRI